MVEIGARVKLTNATDESLRRRGKLAANQVRVVETDAMVDLASVFTVIPLDIREKLGLTIRGERNEEGVGKAVPVTGAVLVEIIGRDTVEEALVAGDQVRIGQTVLEKLDLFPDYRNGSVVPNPAHPDQPVTKVK